MSGAADQQGFSREAPSDPALAEKLDVPETPQAIYLEEASIYRPIATGDLFQDVRVPGSTDGEASSNLTMLIAHPSVMRDGPTLTERAQAAPVMPIAGVHKTTWSPDRFDIFPLPLLKNVCEGNGFSIENKAWAADLRLAGPVETTTLDVQKRAACLSPDGILLLLQRQVHTDTRAAVRLDTLHSVFFEKLEEIELLETWAEDLMPNHVASDPDLRSELAKCAQDFDAFLDTIDSTYECSIRELLGNPLHRGAAQRAVLAEIERRLANADAAS